MNSPNRFITHIFQLPHLGGHYLEIPAKIVEKLGGKFNQRLICTINDSLIFQCGLVALGNGDAYILLNAARMKVLKAREGDEVHVSLQKDESKYGADMPPELEEIFKMDEDGFRRFENLAPGKRRYIIQYISKIKGSQLRIERALRMIENVKKCREGKESFADILNFS